MDGKTTVKGRYEIQGLLTRSGPYATFRANDLVLKREAAFKTLNVVPELGAVQAFLKECELLASLIHPNIVEVVDMGEYEENGHKKPFLVMPLLPGLTLDELIRAESRRLTPPRVAELMSQVCRAIQIFHERGVMHGNLQTSDILVLKDDSIKITGFDGSGSNNSAADVYSLGEICYEALTLRKPEKVSVARSVSELNPQVSPALDRAVRKAMSQDPTERFASARELGDALLRAALNEPIDLAEPLIGVAKQQSAREVPIQASNTPAPPATDWGAGSGPAPGEFTSFFKLDSSNDAPAPVTTDRIDSSPAAVSPRTETIQAPAIASLLSNIAPRHEESAATTEMAVPPAAAEKAKPAPPKVLSPFSAQERTSAEFQSWFETGAGVKPDSKPAPASAAPFDAFKTSVFAEIPEPFKPRKTDPINAIKYESSKDSPSSKPSSYTQVIQSSTPLAAPTSSNGISGTNTFKSPERMSQTPVLRPPAEPSEFTRYMKRPNFQVPEAAPVAETPVQTDPTPVPKRSMVPLAVILGFLFVIAVLLVAWFAIRKP